MIRPTEAEFDELKRQRDQDILNVVREVRKKLWPEPSEEWMFIWFANAMMAMHDHMRPDLAPVILPDGSALVAASLPNPQEPAP